MSAGPGHSEEYAALLDAFQSNKQQVLEIEIVPTSITPPPGTLILIDEACVGVPKKVLVKAFYHATRLFSQNLKNGRDLDDTFDATVVILLFDPEHLTAANHRKRILKKAVKSSPETMLRRVKEEFVFLDSILTSPLHRQSKSPTLWYHRWWLISQLLPQVRFYKDISSRLASEFAVVLKSGERHRNNYYAFQHARRLLALSDPAEASQRLLIRDIRLKLLPWCLEHPSDTSGWSFVYFLLTYERRTILEPDETIEKLLDFVESTRWQREALWVFLRATRMAQGLLSNDVRHKIVRLFERMAAEGCCMPNICVQDPLDSIKR